MFVPETSGKDLPQTLEEFELLFDDNNKKQVRNEDAKLWDYLVLIITLIVT